VARGGGGDGVAAVAEMNRPVELCRWRVAAAELRWCSASSARCCGEAERAGGSESGRGDGMEGARHLCACTSLTGQANAGVLLVGHCRVRRHGFSRRNRRLTASLQPRVTPNPFIHCQNSNNKNYRATCHLQLCFKNHHLILSG